MSAFKTFMSKNGGTALLMAVLVVSLGMNVYLGLRLRGAFAPHIQAIKASDQLPSPLPVLDADGKPTQLAFDSAEPTVVYLFSPLCGWCKRNEANIKSMAAAAGERYRFVGLSTISENLKDYINQGHVPFPVYILKSEDQANKLGLVGTPTTVLVGHDGKVQRVWEGAYMSGSQKDVEKFFDVKLPGLPAEVATVAH